MDSPGCTTQVELPPPAAAGLLSSALAHAAVVGSAVRSTTADVVPVSRLLLVARCHDLAVLGCCIRPPWSERAPGPAMAVPTRAPWCTGTGDNWQRSGDVTDGSSDTPGTADTPFLGRAPPADL